MSVMSLASVGDAHYRLVAEAEPETNSLLRVLEPFVIHDVVPTRVDVARLGSGADAVLCIDIRFGADAPLAARLAARLETMVTVRTCRLTDMSAAMDTAA